MHTAGSLFVTQSQLPINVEWMVVREHPDDPLLVLRAPLRPS